MRSMTTILFKWKQISWFNICNIGKEGVPCSFPLAKRRVYVLVTECRAIHLGLSHKGQKLERKTFPFQNISMLISNLYDMYFLSVKSNIFSYLYFPFLFYRDKKKNWLNKEKDGVSIILANLITKTCQM